MQLESLQTVSIISVAEEEEESEAESLDINVLDIMAKVPENYRAEILAESEAMKWKDDHGKEHQEKMVQKGDEEKESQSGIKPSISACHATDLNDSKLEAVHIVSIEKEERSGEEVFHFNQDQFESIMVQIPEDHKVCILSVLGETRTGKSFLMTWILKYLEAHLGSEPFSKKDEVWYSKLGKLCRGSGSFHWDHGARRTTVGMWMWPKPFFVTREDSSKVAILLIDTQGMNDNKSEQTIQASVFQLTAMMSSYIVYSINYQIDDNNIGQIARFTDFATRALGLDEVEHGGGNMQNKPFQNIDFFVRNFQHADLDIDDDSDILRIESETTEYFHDTLFSDNVSITFRKSRDRMYNKFQKINCYTVPHPGSRMTKKKFEGDLSQIDQSFLVLLDRYCHTIFGFSRVDGKVIMSGSLEAKVIKGRFVSSGIFNALFNEYAKAFQFCGPQVSDAKAILNTASYSYIRLAFDKCNKEYAESMARFMNGSYNLIELTKHHNKAKDNAIETFKRMNPIGTKENIDSAKQNLTEKLQSSYTYYILRNSL